MANAFTRQKSSASFRQPPPTITLYDGYHYRQLPLEEAVDLTRDLIKALREAVDHCHTTNYPLGRLSLDGIEAMAKALKKILDEKEVDESE